MLKDNSTYHHDHGKLERSRHPQLGACDPSERQRIIRTQSIRKDSIYTRLYALIFFFHCWAEVLKIPPQPKYTCKTEYKEKENSCLPSDLAMKQKKAIQSPKLQDSITINVQWHAIS